MWGRPKKKSRENPCNQMWTENPIQYCPGGNQTGVKEVEGEKRNHYTNLTFGLLKVANKLGLINFGVYPNTDVC